MDFVSIGPAQPVTIMIDEESSEFCRDRYHYMKLVQIYPSEPQKRCENIPLLIDHFCRMLNERFHKDNKYNIEGGQGWM